jgi:hypothetical protein
MLVDAGQDLVKNNNANAKPEASPSPSPNASPTPKPNTVAELKKDLQDIDSLAGTYENFGFNPLSAEQFRAFLWSTGVWTKPWADDNGYHSWGGFRFTKELKDGNEISSWHAQSGDEWWESRKDNLVTIVGWAIMIMLLSVGAPFWQDALESLFGIKNLLRQKSATQNIETQSGAGQPRE